MQELGLRSQRGPTRRDGGAGAHWATEGQEQLQRGGVGPIQLCGGYGCDEGGDRVLIRVVRVKD